MVVIDHSLKMPAVATLLKSEGIVACNGQLGEGLYQAPEKAT